MTIVSLDIPLYTKDTQQTCSEDYLRAPFAFKNSMIHEDCNSHYVSHFAAFFIDVGAETSAATDHKGIKFLDCFPVPTDLDMTISPTSRVFTHG